MELATAIGGLLDKFGPVVTGYLILLTVIVYLFRSWRDDVAKFTAIIDAINKDRLADQKKTIEDVLTGLNNSTTSTKAMTDAVIERNATLNKQNELVQQVAHGMERDRPLWLNKIGKLEDVTANIKEDTGEVRRDVSVMVQTGRAR